MRTADAAALLALSLLWGSAFLMVDVVLEDVEPLTIVAGRLIIAAVALAAVSVLLRTPLPPRSDWPVLFVIGALNTVLPFSLITWAQQHIDSSLAATLNATMPIFVFIMAVAIGAERLRPERAVGVLIGFVGAAVLIGADLTDITSSNTLAQLAVIGGAVGYAVAAIISRERLRGQATGFALGQMVFGAMIAVPLALAIDGMPALGDVGAKSASAWVALGVLSSGMAYIIFFALIQRVSATGASVVSYLIPIVAAVLGWLVLDEDLGPNLFAGMALILAGMAAVNGVFGAVTGRGAAPSSAAPDPSA